MNHEVIYQLYPQVKYIVGDVAYDANDQEVPYDHVAVDAVVNSTRYQRQRAAAYPSFADQFDLLYHGGYEAWKEKIQAVKDKYPKP